MAFLVNVRKMAKFELKRKGLVPSKNIMSAVKRQIAAQRSLLMRPGGLRQLMCL